MVVFSVASADSMLGLVKQETDMYAAPESTVSGLTFRDPETGLTYVQTQLLQVGCACACLRACLCVCICVCVLVIEGACMHICLGIYCTGLY